MLILLRGADVYTPEPIGRADVLVAGERIVAVARELPSLPAALGAIEVDLAGYRLVPGLIDAHVHVTGGGGESGPASRVPPLALSSLTLAGVTTCIGLLGTDGTTRTMASLVATTLGLREEGMSRLLLHGELRGPAEHAHRLVRGDIVFVDPIVGVGELAISDHRSSQPTFDELARIAADCHVAGMMSGKAGVLHLHLGDGPRGLELVRRALDETELPARVFHPTHVNRNEAPLRRGARARRARRHHRRDGVPRRRRRGRRLCGGRRHRALPGHRGSPAIGSRAARDGGGCLPTFDADGRIVAMDVGRPAALVETLHALLTSGRALEDVLPVVHEQRRRRSSA